MPNPSPLSLEFVHYAPRKNFTLPSSQGWPPWTRKVKCTQTVGTKNVYYFVGTRLRPRPRTENHHSVICLYFTSCDLISDDCTPHNVYETLSKKKLQRFDLVILYDKIVILLRRQKAFNFLNYQQPGRKKWTWTIFSEH